MRICSICAPIFILAPRYNINKKTAFDYQKRLEVKNYPRIVSFIYVYRDPPTVVGGSFCLTRHLGEVLIPHARNTPAHLYYNDKNIKMQCLDK